MMVTLEIDHWPSCSNENNCSKIIVHKCNLRVILFPKINFVLLSEKTSFWKKCLPWFHQSNSAEKISQFVKFKANAFSLNSFKYSISVHCLQEKEYYTD